MDLSRHRLADAINERTRMAATIALEVSETEAPANRALAKAAASATASDRGSNHANGA
jgi:hypothetical protein